MWHVTLTVGGRDRSRRAVIRAALERLAHEHPFLLAGRYAADRAEVRYWEEADDLADARCAWPCGCGTSTARPAQLPRVGGASGSRSSTARRSTSAAAPAISTCSLGRRRPAVRPLRR